MAGPGDDTGQADAAFKQTEFRAAIRSSAAATTKSTFFSGVPVVGLEDDHCALTQSEIVHGPQKRADALIQRGDECRIEIAWLRQVLVMIKPLGVALIRVVRHVQGEV